jgi:aromatic-L-amino-acid decarboxylase
VNASGQAFLSHTVVDGRYTIRVAIGGVTTTREHVDALWNQLRSTAHTQQTGPTPRS